MVKNLSKNNHKNLDIQVIVNRIKELEKILIENDPTNKMGFKQWIQDFDDIYGNGYVNTQLYIALSLLFLLSLEFISKYILKNEFYLFEQDNSIKKYKDIIEKIEDNYKNVKIFEFNYFEPILTLCIEKNIKSFNKLIKTLYFHLSYLKIEPEFFFDYFIQNFISPIIRHKSGEFYTPPFLVKKMVETTYVLGERVLDPCCGTGNFLIEIAKVIISSNANKKQKIMALNNLYGFDINPLSIYLTKINLLYVLEDIMHDIKVNLLKLDSIFPIHNKFVNYFDLIIGNPPWYTYSDIQSIEYQEKVKHLADQLNIKPQPKNILNIEMASIFFYQSANLYLKIEGKIFFVITKGVITGSHTSRFRNFEGFMNIKIWEFDKDIEKIFNIDFICLFAQKSNGSQDSLELKIPTLKYSIEDNEPSLYYFSHVKLKIKDKDLLVPYGVETKNKKHFTKKFIPIDESKKLIVSKNGHYKNLFHKGADLNPRNLIFVMTEKVNDRYVYITPDTRIFKKAKPPWNKMEYKRELVEKDFIFNVVKSTELVKFFIYDYYQVFLPLSKDNLEFKHEVLPENAKKFYDKINSIYLEKKKVTTKHKSLMENLDRWGKLINSRQLSKIKVVYNNSGSILNAAIILGDFLITGDLSFFETNNLDEAYYLLAILNSDLFTKQVKIMKSSRHIFKLPLDIPIRKFNSKIPNHQKLIVLGQKGQEIAKRVINDISKNGEIKISKFKIQNILATELKVLFKKIDDILKQELDL
ncbi:MAG: class I SAM-dependent DNA methyltransferase [Promethearchaeota archaeon]